MVRIIATGGRSSLRWLLAINCLAGAALGLFLDAVSAGRIAQWLYVASLVDPPAFEQKIVWDIVLVRTPLAGGSASLRWYLAGKTTWLVRQLKSLL